MLFGRLEAGPAFLVEDDRYRPYAFVVAEFEAKLRHTRGTRIEPCGLTDLRGRPVLRVETQTPAGIARLRERLGADALCEADLRFPYRILIDLGLRGGLCIDGEPTPESTDTLLRFRNPDLHSEEVVPTLCIASLDLETTPDASAILSAALVGEAFDEVHVVTPGSVDGAHAHRSEADLLRALLASLRRLDPDVLVGWNVVDFDLRVLAKRCEALGIVADLGRVPGPIAFQQDRGFTRQSRALVAGRMVLDGIGLVRDARKLEDYRLETVAQAVLGRGKLLDQDAPDAAQEIQRLHREEPAALVAYNREDARLVLEILAQEGLLALAIERSSLSGMQLDRVGASIASFDLLYLPELRRRGYVAPSVDREATPADATVARVQGGALLDPVPGFHERVAVFDFRSLYPSLIRTFDLDPLAHALATAGDEAGIVTAPNGARFRCGAGILPVLVERFGAARSAARDRGDRNASQAIKIMSDTFLSIPGTWTIGGRAVHAQRAPNRSLNACPIADRTGPGTRPLAAAAGRSRRRIATSRSRRRRPSACSSASARRPLRRRQWPLRSRERRGRPSARCCARS